MARLPVSSCIHTECESDTAAQTDAMTTTFGQVDAEKQHKELTSDRIVQEDERQIAAHARVVRCQRLVITGKIVRRLAQTSTGE